MNKKQLYLYFNQNNRASVLEKSEGITAGI
jgi:hypothetical protein